mmetsp:Transcript_14023/g.16992  ORF Transcript_14023/g.16992 Transcript_14023/m.16992 type:complete len:281 (-) Transcript_14023:1051-1893(-)|eukprot:CAMPEP_0197859398 /NCGR_PEP_ID=MMETSP1438-20131217/33907_1 /TAXON_ID=1461541 /ORGANISM="Pterosperma sp., Strain CCMP1384" /LENGTH=280 /DNA_ID=CAMNT_0043475865 /DNA_START=307 /DNA_END=1149 /DNA_ORIENTATION=+
MTHQIGTQAAFVRGAVILFVVFCFPTFCTATARPGLGCRDFQCELDEEGLIEGECFCLGASIMREGPDRLGGELSYTHMNGYEDKTTNEKDYVYNCGFFALHTDTQEGFSAAAFNEICDHTSYMAVEYPNGDIRAPESRFLPTLPAVEEGPKKLTCNCEVKDANAVNVVLSSYETFGYNWTGAKTTNVKCQLPRPEELGYGRHLVGYMMEINGYRMGIQSAVPYSDEACIVVPTVRGWPLQEGEVFEQIIIINSANSNRALHKVLLAFITLSTFLSFLFG